ncbi:MAG: VWA domain-containing protein [Chitinophagaceae bacterium]
MILRQTSLSANIVQFCRFLRSRSFTLSVEEEATALDAMQFINYTDRQIFKLALKTVLCRNRKELNEFDILFIEYWKELSKAIDAKLKPDTKPTLKPVSRDASFKSLQSWLNGNRNNEIEQKASYSTGQNLLQKDFSVVPGEELQELMQSIRALSKRMATHLNRRYQKSTKTKLPDLRRSLRKNMRYGGELFHIVFKKPRRNRTKLVILSDVSKSMDLYASFLLQFMFAFQQVYSRIETFSFSTSLQHITPLLKQHDFSAALQVLTAQSEGWSGGTKIGESLDHFSKEYALKVLDKRTIVIILSDGWDTGSIPLLEFNMELIHKKSKKVIWLNPLAGYSLYKPEVAGMQAALPFVDIFAAVYNVESLQKLVKWL